MAALTVASWREAAWAGLERARTCWPLRARPGRQVAALAGAAARQASAGAAVAVAATAASHAAPRSLSAKGRSGAPGVCSLKTLYLPNFANSPRSTKVIISKGAIWCVCGPLKAIVVTAHVLVTAAHTTPSGLASRIGGRRRLPRSTLACFLQLQSGTCHGPFQCWLPASPWRHAVCGRGYTGRVVSATESHVRLELEAQYKTVTVRRDQLPVEQGGQPLPRPAPSYAGLPGSTTPGAATRTPLHVGATPMHAWGSATPLHPSATPLHPGAGAHSLPFHACVLQGIYGVVGHGPRALTV